MQDNTLLWIIGIGIASYFAYEYYESNQTATTAETITPATSTVTTATDTSSTPSQVTTPTQQSGQIATASNLPIQRQNLMNMNQSHLLRR